MDRFILAKLWGEGRMMAQRVRDAWRLVALRHRVALLAAVGIMAFGAWISAVIPVQLGDLATSMERASRSDKPWAFIDARPYLVWLALLFLGREALQIVRRYLVHNACTRIEKDVTVLLIGHILRLEFATLSQERVGLAPRQIAAEH